MKIYKKGTGDNFIQSIKELRYATGLGLFDAKQNIQLLRDTDAPIVVSIFKYPTMNIDHSFSLTEKMIKTLEYSGFTVYREYSISLDEDLFKL